MEIKLTYRVKNPRLGQFETAYNAFPNLVPRGPSGCRVITYLCDLIPSHGIGKFAVVIDTIGLNGARGAQSLKAAGLEAAVESAIVKNAIVDVINAIGGVANGVPWRIEADSKNGYMIANEALKRFNHELRLGGLISRLIGFYYESRVSEIVPERFRNPKVRVVPAYVPA